jgi:D-2-hydroxyacid dehydrogenase (NADP+)
MKVIGISSGRKHAADFDEVHPRAALRDMAARADFLVLLVPYSKDTHHLIDAGVLDAMKPTSFLINLARGGVVDEAALVAHMKAGKIAGAGLDVFSTQPLSFESPLWHLPNTLITPNVGGYSEKFVEQTLTIVEPNLRAFIEGRAQDLRNIVAH